MPEATKSTMSSVAAPETMSRGANASTLAGTGAAYARAISEALANTVTVALIESPLGSQPTVASSPAQRWCSQPATTTVCPRSTTTAGNRAERSRAPVTATSTAAPASGTM